MLRLNAIWHRVYADFLMPPRLEAYRRLLETALAGDYGIHSVISFWRQLQAGRPSLSQRHLVLRHDIDSDVQTARAMWLVERDLGVSATYYFRLRTMDIPFMRDIEASGGEAGYHYEELATTAKECGLGQKDLPRYLPLMRKQFRCNLQMLRERTGVPITTVASHGDFVNRRLGVRNTVLLEDVALRREMGVVLEAYDEAAGAAVTMRCSDCGWPRCWTPHAPEEGLRRGEPVVYLLTHPKHWRANARENAGLSVERLWEDMRYSVLARWRAGRWR